MVGALTCLAMSRKFFVGGNWKMNPTNRAFIDDYAAQINAASLADNVEIVVAPPSIYIEYTRARLSPKFHLSVQNCNDKEKGAFTGEISPEMAHDMKCEYVILGHSERRHIYKETDDFIASKLEHSLKSGMLVIFCIGETLEEREAGKTEEVVFRQMEAAVAKNPDWNKVVIAYEPVWAIGTGKTATPEQAEEVHASLRSWMQKKGIDAEKAPRIIYGGSVNSGNCKELAAKPNIDGFLVGGASLKVPDFVQIINARN